MGFLGVFAQPTSPSTPGERIAVAVDSNRGTMAAGGVSPADRSAARVRCARRGLQERLGDRSVYVNGLRCTPMVRERHFSYF